MALRLSATCGMHSMILGQGYFHIICASRITAIFPDTFDRKGRGQGTAISLDGPIDGRSLQHAVICGYRRLVSS